MCVMIYIMIKASANKEIPKQWWHLWNSTPCCLRKNTEAKDTATSSDKSEATREKILLAAFQEIYKRGFQAASLSNILHNTANTSGLTTVDSQDKASTTNSYTRITKGALYHHFENKTELGYAVLDEVVRPTFHAIWIEPLKNSDDPISALKKNHLSVRFNNDD